jgi:hypothetical protein
MREAYSAKTACVVKALAAANEMDLTISSEEKTDKKGRNFVSVKYKQIEINNVVLKSAAIYKTESSITFLVHVNVVYTKRRGWGEYETILYPRSFKIMLKKLPSGWVQIHRGQGVNWFSPGFDNYEA